MSDMPTSVIVFAAGFGTRMRPLTDNLPKPLISVGGQTLLDRVLEFADAVKPEKTVVNTHYLGHMIKDHLSDRDIEISAENPILETGGGLRNALPLLGGGPVWTANPDVVWRGPNPFEVLRSAWQPDKMDALLLCVPPSRTHARVGSGDFLADDTGRLSRGDGWIYGGIQIVKTEGLAEIEQTAFSLNLLWDLYNTQGRLYGCAYPGHWCDVGTPQAIPVAEAMLEARDV